MPPALSYQVFFSRPVDPNRRPLIPANRFGLIGYRKTKSNSNFKLKHLFNRFETASYPVSRTGLTGNWSLIKKPNP
jgi:hypothetical protein